MGCRGALRPDSCKPKVDRILSPWEVKVHVTRQRVFKSWFEISAGSGTTRPSRIRLEGSRTDSDT